MEEHFKQPVLYSYWRSSSAWRVRIALNYKGIAYDTKFLNLSSGKKEQHTPEYKAINPIGHVPALVIDGHTLIESLNILNYLEETKPQKPLMPSNLLLRARVREICEIITSGIQPLQNSSTVLSYLEEENRLSWAQHWITRGFSAVEKLLATSAGRYCVGDEITLADCCLVPQVYNSRRYEVDMSLFPIILAIDSELEHHPAFRAAHPNAQPDCPLPK